MTDLFVLLAATFFVTPYLVHSLGDRLYGFWSLAGAIVGYYGVLDLGLSAAATRYMSQALGKDDAEELDRVASTAHFLFSMAALGVAAAALLSALACPLFVRDPAEAALFQKLILILGAAAAIGLPSKVYSGLLTAGIRYDSLAAISMSRTLLFNAAVCVCLRAEYGIVAVALISFVVTLLQRAAIWRACKARFPRLKISFFRFDGAKIRTMLEYGWKILVCHLGDILRFRLDSLVIAYFLGAGLVTPYVVGVRLVEGFGQLVRSSVSMLFPVFSRFEGRGDHDAIRSALLKTTKLSTILSVFIGLSVMFYARAFIRRWMGPQFDSSGVVAMILCAAFIIDFTQAPGIQMLFGVSKHQTYAVLCLCEGLVNVALSVLLLRYFGIYGVALGTLIEMAVFKLLVQPVYICRAVSLPVRTYLVDTILVTSLKTAAPLALYFFLIGRFVAPDYLVLTLCAAMQALFFAPVAYFFILGPLERRTISAAIRGLMLRGRPAYSVSGGS